MYNTLHKFLDKTTSSFATNMIDSLHWLDVKDIMRLIAFTPTSNGTTLNIAEQQSEEYIQLKAALMALSELQGSYTNRRLQIRVLTRNFRISSQERKNTF